MDTEQALKSLTPELIQRFKTAIETGKWHDDRKLTNTQRDTCLQAIIAYEHKHLPKEERTGYIPPKTSPCDSHIDEESPVKWKQ